MTRARVSLLLACLAAAAALSCCAPKKTAAGDEGPTGPNPKLRAASLVVGGAKLRVEVAETPGERERGLMFRKSLPEGEGMLFVFEADQRLAFWMKNTSIPLSIAYIASDGTIRQILDLEPFSLDPKGSDRSVRYALEVPRGWFQRAGAKVGDRVLIPAVYEN